MRIVPRFPVLLGWGFLLVPGCQKPAVIEPANARLSIVASSALADSKDANRYAAAKLTDSTLESWCEGVHGNGVGQKLTLSFADQTTGKKAAVRVGKFYIRNGFGRADYFIKNGRVWQMGVKAGKWMTNIHLRDTADVQEVAFAQAFETDSIELTIDKVYPGSQYQDTCITEISLLPMQGTLAAAVIEPFSEVVFRFSSGRQFHLKADQTVVGDLCYGCQLGQPIVNGTWKKEPGIIRIEFSYKKPSDGCAGGDSEKCSEAVMDGDIVLRQASRAGVTDTEGNSGTVLDWKN